MARRNCPIASDAELAESFPADIAVPALLFDYAGWLRGQKTAERSATFMAPRYASDYVPAGVPVDDDFALFINLGDGSAAGLWFGETRDGDAAPFVLMGSEGEAKIYAPNLACFLHRIGLGQFDSNRVENEFDFRRNKREMRAELLSWLTAHPKASAQIRRSVLADYTTCDDGRLEDWLAAKMKTYEEECAADPTLQAIAILLLEAGYRPEKIDLNELTAGWDEDLEDDVQNTDAWDEEWDDYDPIAPDADDDTPCEVEDPSIFVMPVTFQVFAAGDQVLVKQGATISSEGAHMLEDLPPALEAQLVELLRPMREAFARNNPGEGLWPRAILSLNDSNTVSLEPFWTHPPLAEASQFPPAAFAADQAKYPRRSSKLWQWQRDLIAAGQSNVI